MYPPLGPFRNPLIPSQYAPSPLVSLRLYPVFIVLVARFERAIARVTQQSLP